MSDPGDENSTARHSRLVEETTRDRREAQERWELLMKREAARDRLFLAMADAVQLTMSLAYQQAGHSDEFKPIQKELRDAKIIFASTLDRR